MSQEIINSIRQKLNYQRQKATRLNKKIQNLEDKLIQECLK